MSTRGRRYDEILRAAAEKRLYLHNDAGDGEQHISYDNVASDSYDGSLCTDEAMELLSARLLRCVGRRVVITDRGRASLDRSHQEARTTRG